MDLQDHLLHEYLPLLQFHPATHQEPTKSTSSKEQSHMEANKNYNAYQVKCIKIQTLG